MRTYVSRLCSTETRIVVGRGALDVLGEVDGEASIIHSKRVDPGAVVGRVARPSSIIGIDDGERAKDIERVLEIIRIIHRSSTPDLEWVIAVGGGTVLDVAGFVASIYRRGVKLANVPTTLLGMVDAAMGGKNGVNFEGAKNMLGTFYQPRLVVSDTSFLSTLPKDEISNGLAEVIKYCITLDRELCKVLEGSREEILGLDEGVLEDIIYRSAVDKMKVVEADERDDRGVRIVLNYGHTIGHAIEAGSGFSIAHGRAISVGMICEARLAQEMGLIDRGVVEYLESMLRLYGLPTSAKELGVQVDPGRALEALRRDKKRRRGSILVPLLSGIGSWVGAKVDLEEVEVCLKKCLG